MKRHKSTLAILIFCIFMFVLIIDSKTALSGASEGLMMCARVIVPSLFPFFIVSTVLTGLLSGVKIPFLHPLGKLLHLPENTENIFLIGLLGGYPIGAQCIAQAYQSGNLSRRDAERMLAFCSNAGPAFIFGIGASVLPSPWMCWLLWFIHILSAILVGVLTPAEGADSSTNATPHPVSLTEAVSRSTQVLATVCGWIILFRTILAFLQRWFLWLLSKSASTLLCGILELANGCCSLIDISSIGLRFTFFSVMLAFGGLCVILQTRSVLAECDLSIQYYFPGKITQAAISYLLCSVAAAIFSQQLAFAPSIWALTAACIPCLSYRMIFRKTQKEYSISPAAIV